MTVGPMREQWYPVAMSSQLPPAGRDSLLLGEPIRVFAQPDGMPGVIDGT